MRKSSYFASRRGCHGRMAGLGRVAHSNANSKVTQLVSNRLLIKLLGVCGITERGIYAKIYGEEFANQVFGPAPVGAVFGQPRLISQAGLVGA